MENVTKSQLTYTRQSWGHMKDRCLNPKNHAYHHYGGRGIEICQSWVSAFDNFLKDMGPRPSRKYSLERKDSNGDYNQENCKWALSVEQNNNKDSTNWVVYSYQTTQNYSDTQLKDFEDIEEIRLTLSGFKKSYPSSEIKGGVKILTSTGNLIVFGILSKINKYGLNIGDKIHRLTLLEPLEVGNRGRIIWKWECDCGNYVSTRIDVVNSGNTKSCGCLHRERVVTHGMAKNKIYKIWDYTKQKCNNPKCSTYYSFGGKGIGICKEWELSFEKFLIDVGEPPLKKTKLKLKDGEVEFNKDTFYWD